MTRSIRLAGFALALVALTVSPALADEATRDAKKGASVVLANVVYMPAKVLYAAGGGIVAGFAYLFSAGDKEVAKPILDAAIGGDYVVESEHLAGDKKLVFFGESQELQDSRETVVGDVAAQPEPGF
jgi:hypothetical protein